MSLLGVANALPITSQCRLELSMDELVSQTHDTIKKTQNRCVKVHSDVFQLTHRGVFQPLALTGMHHWLSVLR